MRRALPLIPLLALILALGSPPASARADYCRVAKTGGVVRPQAKDYHIWRRAVFAKSARDFDRVGELSQELREARAYKAIRSAG